MRPHLTNVAKRGFAIFLSLIILLAFMPQLSGIMVYAVESQEAAVEEMALASGEEQVEEAPAETQVPAVEAEEPAEETDGEQEQPAGDTTAAEQEDVVEAEAPAETETEAEAPAAETDEEETAEEQATQAEAEQTMPVEEEAAPAPEKSKIVAKPQSSGVVASGNCGSKGDNIKWSLSDAGTLTLKGSGSLAWYQPAGPMGAEESLPPWYKYRKKIKKVIVKAGITNLRQMAFEDCTNLTEVYLGEGLKDLGNSTFQNTAVRELVLPDSLSSLDATALMGMQVKLSTRTSKAKLKVVNDVVFSRSGKTLYLYQGSGTSYAIPKGTQIIKEYAFSDSKLRKVTIPNTVKTIEFRAFAGSALASVTIPDSVTELDTGAFTQCPALKSAVIGDNVPVLDATFDWCYALETCKIGKRVRSTDATFRGCRKLHDVVLPAGLKEIGWATFYECKSITSIKIPDTVTTVGRGAFYDTGLRSLVLPASVTSVGSIVVKDGVKLTLKNKDLISDGEGGYKLDNTHAFSGKNVYSQAYEVLKLVNAERTKKGLKALKMDKSLMDAAMIRAAETVILFSHTRPGGDSCFSVNKDASGENIAMGSRTAAGTMDQWMNSPGHKANILNSDWTTIGIGCFEYGGVRYWAQLFGMGNNKTNAAKPANKTVTVKTDIATKPFYDSTTGGTVSFKFKMNKKSIRGAIGQTKTLKLQLNGVTFKGSSVRWKSTNPKVATVSRTGKVTLRGEGKCTIKACSAEAVRATCTVTVGKDISKAKAVLARTSYTYNGKSKKPKVTIKYKGKPLKKGKDYTVTYKKNKKVGTATVVITGKGAYAGVKKKTFKIRPQASYAKSLEPGRKQIAVAWKTRTTQTTGYQVQYSTSKSFKKGAATKTITIKDKARSSKTLKKLKAKKTYYVHVRTYKKTGGKTYYSKWSKTKRVRTK